MLKLEARVREGIGWRAGEKGVRRYRGLDEAMVDKMKGVGRKLELKERVEIKNNIVREGKERQERE